MPSASTRTSAIEPVAALAAAISAASQPPNDSPMSVTFSCGQRVEERQVEVHQVVHGLEIGRARGAAEAGVRRGDDLARAGRAGPESAHPGRRSARRAAGAPGARRPGARPPGRCRRSTAAPRRRSPLRSSRHLRTDSASRRCLSPGSVAQPRSRETPPGRRLTRPALPATVRRARWWTGPAWTWHATGRRSHERPPRREPEPVSADLAAPRAPDRRGDAGGPAVLVPGAAAQTTKPGANLIGKLEGAEVVTDPALYPKSFKEAPQLAELVKAGKLPPVQERIGQDPARRQAAARDRQVRRHLAPGLHRALRHLQRPPRRPERQAALLRLHGHQARPQHRAGLGGQPGRQGHHALARAAGCSGATARPSPPTTSSSGTRTCT